ncbi:MAG: RpiB/LacA/LacB family sugar-phosphate isomerase, partial [Gemmatimonadales bacterium]|nr:RpiB/LacA/LacB family sugar-phosphate isomerase [Gemmatimonadales bacterium]
MSKARAITEADVRRAAGGARTLAVAKGAVVTPAARDLAKQLGVALVSTGDGSREPGAVPSTRDAGTAPASRLPTIALGADHGGFPMKEHLKGVLAELGHDVLDVGTFGTDPVDYPDFAVAVARAVVDGRAWRGIMVDGAGIGSSMAANKVPGVRAALCYDLTTAA